MEDRAKFMFSGGNSCHIPTFYKLLVSWTESLDVMVATRRAASSKDG